MRRAYARADVLDADVCILVRVEHEALDLCEQFANVAGPRITLQHADGLRSDARDRTLVAARVVGEKVRDKRCDVLRSFAQRRDVNREGRDAVVQVFAESAFAYSFQ